MLGTPVVDVESEAATVGPGSRGRVKTVAGLWLRFEITEVRPGRSCDWNVAGIPITGYTVENSGVGRSSVEFTAPLVLARYVIVPLKGSDD